MASSARPSNIRNGTTLSLNQVPRVRRKTTGPGQVGLYADCFASELPHNPAGITRKPMNDQASPLPETTQASVPARASAAKIIKWSLAALVLLVAIGLGIRYWRQSRLYVTTDNAYVNANRVE